MAIIIDPERVRRRSEAETFGCPKRYNDIYNLGIDDSGDEAVRGRAFHVVFYIYVMRLVACQLQQDHEEAGLALTEGIAASNLPDHLVTHVSKIWWKFVEGWQLDLGAFLAAEELQQHRGRVFRPDLVYARPTELEIIDVKTYYKGLTPTQAGEELQLRWYLVEALKSWPGFARYRFTFKFVRLGYEVSLVFTPDEILGWESEVQGSIDAIDEADRKGEYPAIPGSHCAFCRLRCPIVDDDRRMPVRILDAGEFAQVGGDIITLERRLKNLKAIAKAYCSVEGPQELNGQLFMHRPIISRTYPAAAVIDYLREHDSDPSAITLSHSALGDMGNPKKVPEAVTQFLDEIVQTSQSFQFRHAKGGLADIEDPDEEKD